MRSPAGTINAARACDEFDNAREVDAILDELAVLQARFMSGAANLLPRFRAAATGSEQAALHHSAMTREFLDAQRALLRRRLLTADSLETLGVTVETGEDDRAWRASSAHDLRRLLDAWWEGEGRRCEEIVRRGEVALALQTHFSNEADECARSGARTMEPMPSSLSPTITQILDDAGDGDLVLALSMLVDDLRSESTQTAALQPAQTRLGDHRETAREEISDDQPSGIDAALVLDGVPSFTPTGEPGSVDYSQDAFDRFWTTLPPKPRRSKRRLARGCMLIAGFGAGSAIVASGLGWS